MNQYFYMLEGAAALAAGVGIGMGLRKAWQLAQQVVKALSGIPKLIESNQVVADRLELLTNILTGQQPVQNLESPGQPQPRAPLPPRPSSYERFVPVTYEAEENETEVIDTTEAELAAYEELDEIRARGFTVEEDLDKNPPGVTAEV